MKHQPVMLREALEYLAVRPEGSYLDATTGLGGHSEEIVKRLKTGRLIAADRDGESLGMAMDRLAPHARMITPLKARFSELTQRLSAMGIEQVDGLLADLGVSSYQLTEPGRGFSFMHDGPLDMRMDRSGGPTAADIVNFSSEKELSELLFRLGEERRARRLARAIVRSRPVHTTSRLAQIIEQAAPRTGRIHAATRCFLALRRATCEEPQELAALLEQAPRLVRPGGRIVIISFMSLEDREVKQSFQALAKQGIALLLTRKIVTPGEDEAGSNPRSRSAKLRAIQIQPKAG